MAGPRFSIGIAVHNELHWTEQCLAPILSRHRPDVEVLVFDNASTDGTAAYLASLGGAVVVYDSHINLGFGAAQNQLFAASRGEFFVVLNNDTILPADWLERLVDPLLKDSQIALVGVLGTCASLNSEGEGRIDNGSEYVEASCLMVRSSVARSHGLFDPDLLFAYFEDSDLSLRLRQRGFGIAHVDLPGFQHVRARTANNVAHAVDLRGYYLRNQVIFKQRWGNYLRSKSFAVRTLVKRRGAAGDVLLMTPILHELKRLNAHRQIHVVTESPEVLLNNPHIVSATRDIPGGIVFDETLDLDLAYENRPKTHIVEAYAAKCGIEPPKSYLGELFPSGSDEAWALSVMPVTEAVLVLHPGPISNEWPGRNWPIHNFQEVADHFKSLGWLTVAIGNESTPFRCDVDLRRQTTCQRLYACLKHADLFIGLDSLPMHVALAAGVPVVAAFGCISPEYRLPPHSVAKGVTANNVGCLGCHHYLPAPRTQSGCFRDSPYCMTALSPSIVISAALDLLRKAEHLGSVR